MNKFLVFLEQRDGVVKNNSIDVWNLVQKFAASLADATVMGIIAGPADILHLNGLMIGDGVIYHADQEELVLYNQVYYIRLIVDIMRQSVSNALFFADSALSRDLAPRLSVCLKASLLSGNLLFNQSGEPNGCYLPVYSGLATASFVPKCNLSIYQLSSRKILTESSVGGRIDFVTFRPQYVTVEKLFPVVQRIVMLNNRLDIVDAGIIVAGGRGMGGTKGFALLEQLAAILGGTVGASRSVVDAGVRPHAEQIGLTGKTVSPAFYFACGISGSVQHLAGIGSAGIVVAINNDYDAPIFDVSDYGIVGDVHVILPKLIEAVKEFLKTK
ncbi:MAG: electron transfer flavoprotein subunit alpha/FixB family protein [Chlorobiaceae bacterium]